MLTVKSAKELRMWIIKTQKKLPDFTQSKYDPDFIGCVNPNPTDEREFGFFEVYHGIKPNVKDFLATPLRTAEDGQAIYEFLQNAADCQSDIFSIFYDEHFFLALNNGTPFTPDDLIT